MKTINSTEAQKQFGLLLDTAIHEPVSITRRNRDVVIILAAKQFYQLVEAAKTCLQLASPAPEQHALLSLLNSGREIRAFQSPQDIDNWLRNERDSWDAA
ncbi:MAG: Antitoxin Phd YefM, type toxin-antitoxin system [Pseudomonadota bacterium]|jgi:PHD/YefM family antitoxin component YafN of YafNO toxin-antitoxin module